jgi:single-stranded-DNA-specific exonuclease
MRAEAVLSSDKPAFGVARSYSGRRWIFRDGDNEAVRALARDAKISSALAQLLHARGVDAATVEDFLRPTLKRLLPEPRLLKDMDRAVERTRVAIEARLPVAVLGDYDVDGSSSAALLHDFLSTIGTPPRIYIPDRMTEGYGPSAHALLALKEEGASLVLTVDCGAAAQKALGAAREAGLDVVVLDHHAVHELPPAFAQVNPNQPGDESGQGHLSAAGVTFLFVVALNRALRESGWYSRQGVDEPDLRNGLDLVGLSTICDVVPLEGVNRAFVRWGLAKLAEGARTGLAALVAQAKVSAPFTPYHFGFILGPRINAGGRVGRSSLGVELLTSRDPEAARAIAARLDLHNKERQALETMILEEAIALASLQDNQPFLLAANEGWHSGVVGIVAGRLKDRFNKPAFVAGFEGGMGRGSARSIAGIDIGALVRGAHKAGIIDAGGGHAMAAGFSLQTHQLEPFRAYLADKFAHAEDALLSAADLDIEAIVSPAAATASLVEEMALAGPFGAGNPEPIVVTPDVQLTFADIVGKNHVRMRLVGGDGARLDAVAFRSADTPLGKALLGARGRRIHAVGRLRAEEWQGRPRVQLHLEDAAPAGA